MVLYDQNSISLPGKGLRDISPQNLRNMIDFFEEPVFGRNYTSFIKRLVPSLSLYIERIHKNFGE